MKRALMMMAAAVLLLAACAKEETPAPLPDIPEEEGLTYPDAEGRYGFQAELEDIPLSAETKGRWDEVGGKLAFSFRRYETIAIWDEIEGEFVLFYVEDSDPGVQPVQIWSAIRDTIPRCFTVAYYPASIAVLNDGETPSSGRAKGMRDVVNIPSEVTFQAASHWNYYAFKAQVSGDDVAPDKLLRFKSLLSYVKVTFHNPPMEVMPYSMKDYKDTDSADPAEPYPVHDYVLKTSKPISGRLSVGDGGDGLYYAEAGDGAWGSVTVKDVPYFAESNEITIPFPVPKGNYTIWMELEDNVGNIISKPTKNNFDVQRGKVYHMQTVDFGLLMTFKNTNSSWKGTRRIEVRQITRGADTDPVDTYSGSEYGNTAGANFLTFTTDNENLQYRIRQAKYTGDPMYSGTDYISGGTAAGATHVQSVNGDDYITEYIILPVADGTFGWLSNGGNGVRIQYFNDGTAVAGTERVFLVNDKLTFSNTIGEGRTADRLLIRRRYYDFTICPDDNWDSGSSHDTYSFRFPYYFISASDAYGKGKRNYAHLWRPVKFFFRDETGWGNLSMEYAGFNWRKVDEFRFQTDRNTTTGEWSYCNPNFYPMRERTIGGTNYKWSLMFDGHLDLIHKSEWEARATGYSYEAIRKHRALPYKESGNGRTGLGDEMDADPSTTTGDVKTWLKVYRQNNYDAGQIEVPVAAGINYTYDQYFRIYDSGYTMVYDNTAANKPTSPHPDDQNMQDMYGNGNWYYFRFGSNSEWINDVEFRANLFIVQGGHGDATGNILIGRMDRDRILFLTGQSTFKGDGRTND